MHLSFNGSSKVVQNLLAQPWRRLSPWGLKGLLTNGRV
ncbi:hypothetical protein Gotri_004523 [Gossypium trilobum]|uniref:Uncharacterized protein n=1 Tax=Gossypium trilobum TaxID=34281 RepID=A0A7J9F549_9ROSI|nr:hypothetical protein [Gossypium trilobum]